MDCGSCEKRKTVDPVPYIVHESAMARNERTIKRLVIALIIAVALLFAGNAAWLYAWMQYDYVSEETITEYQQDGEGLNIIGNDNEAGIYGAGSTD